MMQFTYWHVSDIVNLSTDFCSDVKIIKNGRLLLVSHMIYNHTFKTIINAIHTCITYIHVNAYINTQTHTYTHTYTDAYKQIDRQMQTLQKQKALH